LPGHCSQVRWLPSHCSQEWWLPGNCSQECGCPATAAKDVFGELVVGELVVELIVGELVNGELVALKPLLKSLGIPTPRNPHYQALAISLVWPTPLSFPVTKYLAHQEFNRDIPLTMTIQEYMHNRSTYF
jgi:hypothetical protein